LGGRCYSIGKVQAGAAWAAVGIIAQMFWYGKWGVMLWSGLL
jgi:hypothetical protein